MTDFVYLDYNATTPVDQRVVDAMLPYFNSLYANSGSSHLFGLTMKEAIDEAGEQIAELISANPKEIIYTSGATEAVNLALKGIEKVNGKNHIITVKTEHKAVLDTCQNLEQQGFSVTYLDVGKDGLINLDDLKNAITDKTLMVCVMFVNNETGVIQPIKEITKIAHDKNCLVFCDATQTVGKIPVNVKDLGIDIMAFSAHKFYGPKGIGALYVSSHLKKNIVAQIHGGAQQFNLRSGTLNVPGIIGMGKAAEIALQEMASDSRKIKKLRDELENYLLKISNTFINGDKDNRIYNTSNICFSNVNSEQMILSLGNICVSSGSACNATTSKPSHVLKAMGISDLDALSSIRLSLGKFTTISEIKTAVEKIEKIVLQLRKES
ncbi:cysteine desulfurase family protein [Epilithonimonas lactis]|uniref:cysteine desulfurase n=1 Tax=Epilithonimonas lactis TaxID=421072 RepID=A0A085B6I4_9FLAO|nr:cysteine desulfurase family protein [Epilithonimonas lactis]KFC18079.1 cysteine desulfurase [Epilithonimonas lactis]SER12672.1 cysteine desulfurase IscS [Epilithonimonas lactis]